MPDDNTTAPIASVHMRALMSILLDKCARMWYYNRRIAYDTVAMCIICLCGMFFGYAVLMTIADHYGIAQHVLQR